MQLGADNDNNGNLTVAAQSFQQFEPKPLNFQFKVRQLDLQLLQDDDDDYYDKCMQEFNNGNLSPDLAKDFNKQMKELNNNLSKDEYIKAIKSKVESGVMTIEEYTRKEAEYSMKQLQNIGKDILENAGIIKSSLLDDLPLHSEEAVNTVTTILKIVNSGISNKAKLIQLMMISDNYFDLIRNNVVAFMFRPRIMIKFIESDIVDGVGAIALGLVKKPAKWILNKITFW